MDGLYFLFCLLTSCDLFDIMIFDIFILRIWTFEGILCLFVSDFVFQLIGIIIFIFDIRSFFVLCDLL